jgi:hypothetical protein
VDQSREELLQLTRDALADDEAQALREQLVDELAARLADNGLRLSIHHELGPDRAGIGFAAITEMAAELSAGAAHLFRQGLWYPGAALVRQLLECGYLLALAADRRDEPEEWLTGSREQIRATFSAGQMRKRATRAFRVSEYQAHCEYGGHPHPAGRRLLRHHVDYQPLSPRSQWADLAQHVAETWEGFCLALPHYDPRQDPDDPLYSPERSPDGGSDVAATISAWRKRDAFSGRRPIPGIDTSN